MKRTITLLALAAFVALSAAGCRCASGSEQTAPDEEASGQGSGESASAESDAWLAGNLEAQMPEGEPRRGGEIVFQLDTEPPSLNTIADSDLWATRLTTHHIYECLIRRDPYDAPGYRYVPELAERWEESEDHKVHTFYLRRDVKWHDGRDFTARDVIATFDKIADEAVRAAHVRPYTEGLEKWEAVDDHTLRFTWKEPYFLALDVFSGLPIHPAHIIADMSGSDYNEAATNPLNRHPIGTGPWKFVEWESNQKIVFVRNGQYWARPPYLDRIVFRIVKEEAIGLQLAERGELDVVIRIRPETWEKMADNQSLRTRFFRAIDYDNNYAWIGWNTLSPFFSDKRVRRAMTHLVDVRGIIDRLQYGLPRQTTCHFYWRSEACPEIEPLAHDVEPAVSLLEEAGWTDSDGDGVRDKDGRKFEFTFMIPATSEDMARMGTKMKEDFARAGVEVNLQRVEWSSFLRRLREHEFDACTLLWGNTSPETDPSQIWHSSSNEGGSNYISYGNDRVDAIIDQAKTVFDTDQRNALYRELGELLYADQPYTWLYTRPRLALLNQRIRGAKNTLMFWQYEDFWLAPEQP